MPETKIQRLLNNIEFNELVLPEFQREYIWRRAQAKSFLESLFKNYPTGGVLFWRTTNPPKLKNEIERESGKLTEVILDGQQRLVTLYLLTKNKPPPFYQEREIKHDPRNLYINLENGDFMYYIPSRMQNNPLWVKVTDCFENRPSSIRIAQSVLSGDEDFIDLGDNIDQNLNNLLGILKMPYPVQNAPDNVSTSKAIEMFIRVNEEGTMPTDAELALAKISDTWGVARRKMKEKQRDLEKQGFQFNLDFFVRCLTGVVSESARLETIQGATGVELRTRWKELRTVLDYTINILRGSFHIHSMRDIRTNLLLIPLIVYLSRNQGQFEQDRMKKRFMGWLYVALAWRRYTGSTVAKLDKDISLVVGEETIQSLINQILEERGRVQLSEEDLEEKSVRHPLYRVMLILSKMNGAIDWFNGSPLSPNAGRSYSIESHHIFPKSILYSQAYDGEDTDDRRRVNEIANRAFLTKRTNLEISNNDPYRYLTEVRRRYPEALRKQFVPEDDSLWRISKFEEFKRERRKLIAEKFNEILNELLKGIHF